jgi:hypothetical protein
MPRKDPEARKQYQKEYAQKNKETAYARIKEWRENNPDKVAAQNKRYAEKHKDVINAKSKRWVANNPERSAELSRKSRLKHMGRVLANKAKYIAAKKNRTPNWLMPIDIFEMQCIYTYRASLQRTGLEYEVDHIIPMQGETVSGLHVPENLQVIPKEENRLKSNRYGY